MNAMSNRCFHVQYSVLLYIKVIVNFELGCTGSWIAQRSGKDWEKVCIWISVRM